MFYGAKLIGNYRHRHKTGIAQEENITFTCIMRGKLSQQ